MILLDKCSDLLYLCIMNNTPNTPTANFMFINPNPSKGVVATPLLNQLYKWLKSNWTLKNQMVDDGFSINPIYFTWECHFKFKNKDGFIVLTENGKDITLYAYATDNDLEPVMVIIQNAKPSHNVKIAQLMFNLWKTHIK